MLASQGAVTMAFEADSDGQADGQQQQQQQQRISFGASAVSPALVETSGVGRHLYFRTRKLQRVAEAF